MNIAYAISLAFVMMLSLVVNIVALKSLWYEAATTYRSYDEVMVKAKRVVALFILGLNLVNVILYLAYAISVISL